MREDYDIKLLLLHLKFQPECHEELHEPFPAFLHWGTPQQGIRTQAVAF